MELFQGLRLILANPRLWPLCVRPLLWALVGYVALGALTWWLVIPPLAHWVGAGGISGLAAGMALSLLLLVVWLHLFPVLFLGLSGAFASFFWDRLSLEVERLEGGEPPTVALSTPTLILDSVIRLVLALAVSVVALVGALFTGPVAPAVAAGFLGLLDFSSPAALRRGWTLRQQKRRLLRPSGFGFALAVGVTSLIPIVNLFVWPAAVVGGTLLVRRMDAAVEAR